MGILSKYLIYFIILNIYNKIYPNYIMNNDIIIQKIVKYIVIVLISLLSINIFLSNNDLPYHLYIYASLMIATGISFMDLLYPNTFYV